MGGGVIHRDNTIRNGDNSNLTSNKALVLHEHVFYVFCAETGVIVSKTPSEREIHHCGSGMLI